MHSRTLHRIAAVTAIVWMAVIYGFSALPGSSVPSGPPQLGHFALYAVLGALCYLAIPGDRHHWRILAAIAIASLYGVSDEFHQSFVPGRQPDVMDWAVDTIGAAIATLTVWAALRHRDKKPVPGRGRVTETPGTTGGRLDDQ